jgi:hypothetical protein
LLYNQTIGALSSLSNGLAAKGQVNLKCCHNTGR